MDVVYTLNLNSKLKIRSSLLQYLNQQLFSPASKQFGILITESFTLDYSVELCKRFSQE
jgi:hypothetical protein